MGPRVLCEMSREKWKPMHKRYQLKRTLMSIERACKVPPIRKNPVTISDLLAIAKSMSSKQMNDIGTYTAWCATLIGFFSFLRKANYTTDSPYMFDPNTDLCLSILVKKNGRWGLKVTKTKTIQFGQRELVIWLPKLACKSICPCTAIDRMISLRKNLNPDSPLFSVDEFNTPLTKRVFGSMFKMFLKRAGIFTSSLSPHSLRRGGATYALECGASVTCMKIQANWEHG
jgi:integrase